MSFAAQGQVTNGTISGVIRDPSGAAIPHGHVTAIDQNKGTQTEGTSNSRGEYEFANLLPASYTLTVTAPGFDSFTATDLVVQVNSQIKYDFSLRVGHSSEVVEVSGATTLLDTSSGSLGQVVTQQQIEELPLDIRDPLGLVALTPGAVLGPDFGNGGGPNIGRNFFKSNFNVGGGKSGSQAILIDGAPNTTGDISRAIINPPVDAVQEFKVQAASYDAQFGRTSGGIVNMLTKSGSDSIHGAVYDFERNSSMSALNYFSSGNVPSYGRRQVGGVVGFPILHDRLFGFADFEALRQAVPESFVDTVPTDAEKAGDFSGVTYTSKSASGVTTTSPVIIYDPATYSAATKLRSQIVGCDGVTKNVICASRINPIAQKLLALYPKPNAAGDPNGTGNYLYTANQTTNSNKYDFRADYKINSSTNVFGRYSRQDDQRLVPAALPPAEAGTLTHDIYTQVVLGATRILSPNIVANVTTSFSRANGIQVGGLAPVDITTFGFSGNYASQAAPQLPQISTTDVTGLQQKSNVGQQHQPRNTYATLGSVTWLRGHHSLKFGGEAWNLNFNEFQNSVASGLLKFDHSFTQQNPASGSSKLQGADVASFLLGIPSGTNAVSGTQGSYLRKVQGISTGGLYYAAFAQDDWRATDRLTLNLGLRWDVNLGDYEKYDRLAWFDPNAPSPLGPSIGNASLKGQVVWTGQGNDRAQQQTSWWNIQPRFGFAYQLPRSLVLRGGYGIFFLPRSVQGSGVGAVETTVDTVLPIDSPTPTNTLANPFASGVEPLANDRSPVANVGSTISIPTHDFEAAYVQLFSFGIQGKMFWGIVGDVHYWANLGTHVPTTANLNALPDSALASCQAANNCATLATTKVTNPFYGIIPGAASTVTLRQSLLPFPQYIGDSGVAQQLVGVGRTNYNALTAQAQKQFSKSLSFTAQYTWGKAMDNLGTPVDYANRSAEYGLSALDVTNQFIASFVGQLPYGHNRHFGGQSNRYVNWVLGDWNVNGIVQMQSGLPVSITRPSNLAPGATPRLSNPTPQRWFDTTGITTATYSYGNVGIDLPGVRTDPVRSINAVVEKNFPARWHRHEINTQIRAECYNAFNHPQFAAPIGTITSATFGTVTSQLNQPRAFQFAAKVKF